MTLEEFDNWSKEQFKDLKPAPKTLGPYTTIESHGLMYRYATKEDTEVAVKQLEVEKSLK